MNSTTHTAGQDFLATHYNELRTDTQNRWIVGEIKVWTTTSAPNSDWMICDGSAISRSTYSVLFALISTKYGVGNGTTTFNIPNLKGRVPVCIDSGQTEFDVLGETGGAKTHSLSVAEMPAHTHTFGIGVGGGGASIPGQVSDNTVDTTVTTNSNGSGTAHNNLQPYIVLNYIICVTNI